MRARALLGYGSVAALAVIADQLVKRWAEVALPFHEPVDVLPFLALFRTHNTGMAFSMLSWVSGTGLSLIVLAVIAFILLLAVRTRPNQYAARLGFALIIGGAVGNLIDRLMLGYVIDYVLFHTPVWSFAIFNLADAMITVGAGFVLLDEFLAWRRERAGRNG